MIIGITENDEAPQNKRNKKPQKSFSSFFVRLLLMINANPLLSNLVPNREEKSCWLNAMTGRAHARHAPSLSSRKRRDVVPPFSAFILGTDLLAQQCPDEGNGPPGRPGPIRQNKKYQIKETDVNARVRFANGNVIRGTDSSSSSWLGREIGESPAAPCLIQQPRREKKRQTKYNRPPLSLSPYIYFFLVVYIVCCSDDLVDWFPSSTLLLLLFIRSSLPVSRRSVELTQSMSREKECAARTNGFSFLFSAPPSSSSSIEKGKRKKDAHKFSDSRSNGVPITTTTTLPGSWWRETSPAHRLLLHRPDARLPSSSSCCCWCRDARDSAICCIRTGEAVGKKWSFLLLLFYMSPLFPKVLNGRVTSLPPSPTGVELHLQIRRYQLKHFSPMCKTMKNVFKK